MVTLLVVELYGWIPVIPLAWLIYVKATADKIWIIVITAVSVTSY